MSKLYSLIEAERQRQNELHGETNKNNLLTDWAAILGEEYGELCKAIIEFSLQNKGSAAEIEKECVHVAAVAKAIWEELNKEDKQ